MNGVILLLAAASLGVDYDWVQQSDGTVRYVMQISPEALTSSRPADSISSQFPPELAQVSAVEIRIGPPSRRPPITEMEGIDVGWQRQRDNTVRYIVQITPEALAKLTEGDAFVSQFPTRLHGVRSVEIRLNRGAVPQDPAIAMTDLRVADARGSALQGPLAAGGSSQWSLPAGRAPQEPALTPSAGTQAKAPGAVADGRALPSPFDTPRGDRWQSPPTLLDNNTQQPQLAQRTNQYTTQPRQSVQPRTAQQPSGYQPLQPPNYPTGPSNNLADQWAQNNRQGPVRTNPQYTADQRNLVNLTAPSNQRPATQPAPQPQQAGVARPATTPAAQGQPARPTSREQPTTAATTPTTPPKGKSGGWWALMAAAFLLSLAANIYLGHLALESYWRYRQMLADQRSVGAVA